MRLADRLFAVWRMPAWSDPVQVLLWMLGWAVAVVALVSLALGPVRLAVSLSRRGPADDLSMLALGLMTLVTLGAAIMASWFVSEAYRGWRAGHPHGRQWCWVIGSLLLLPLFLAMAGPGAETLRREGIQGSPYAMVVALEAAIGLSLLVASLTTKPPGTQAAAANG